MSKSRMFHKVIDIEGKEVQVLDEEHVRDTLVGLLKWVGSGLLGYLVVAAIWAFNISSDVSDATRDIADLKETRINDTSKTSQVILSNEQLRREMDSLRITFRDFNTSIVDLSEDIRAVRRTLRLPR